MPKTNILMIVHPGSACGSANFNLGKENARSARDELASDILKWNQGPVVVLDGSLSDELEFYPGLNTAILGAIERNPGSLRRFACDNEAPHPDEVIPSLIRGLKWKPSTHTFTLTGAWYHPDGSTGCVTNVLHLLTARGFHCLVADGVMLDAEAVAEHS